MDSSHLSRLAGMIEPVAVADFAGAVCRWLQDAHEAAADLQPLRRHHHRGAWHNNTSFGTDRHQYLRNTAASLSADLPDLQVDSDFQSVLLRLPRAGIYQFQQPGGPEGSLGDTSELRRELLTTGDPHALFSRRDALLAGRAMLLLSWSGTEEHGLTGASIGQGELVDNHVEWQWLLSLTELGGDRALPVHFGPDIFTQPQPELPIRPRTERQADTS